MKIFRPRAKLQFASFLAVIFTGLTAGAQVHLDARDKSIRYDLIRPSHTLYKEVSFDTTGKVTRELVIDHVTAVDTAKKEIAFINSVPFAPGKLLVDSSIDNYSGSARYILATFPNTKYEFIKYLSASVEAHNIVKGVNTNKTTPMREGYFDDNSIWDMIGIIPFKKGVTYQLDCYGTDTHTQVSIPYELEYMFDDENQGPDGLLVYNKVLRVSYDGTVAYLWINKKTHLLTREFSQGKGYTFTKVAL